MKLSVLIKICTNQKALVMLFLLGMIAKVPQTLNFSTIPETSIIAINFNKCKYSGGTKGSKLYKRQSKYWLKDIDSMFIFSSKYVCFIDQNSYGWLYRGSGFVCRCNIPIINDFFYVSLLKLFSLPRTYCKSFTQSNLLAMVGGIIWFKFYISKQVCGGR